MKRPARGLCVRYAATSSAGIGKNPRFRNTPGGEVREPRLPESVALATGGGRGSRTFALIIPYGSIPRDDAAEAVTFPAIPGETKLVLGPETAPEATLTSHSAVPIQ